MHMGSIQLSPIAIMAAMALPIIHIHSRSFAVTIVSVVAAVVLLAYLPSFFYVNMEFDTLHSRNAIFITV